MAELLNCGTKNIITMSFPCFLMMIGLLVFNLKLIKIILLFRVYLPCAHHSIDMFKEYLDRLQNIIPLHSENGMVVSVGDFNAYLPITCFRKRVDYRNLYLQSFVHDNNMLSLNTSKL